MAIFLFDSDSKYISSSSKKRKAVLIYTLLRVHSLFSVLTKFCPFLSETCLGRIKPNPVANPNILNPNTKNII